jgi:hypothetical protein
MYGRDPHECRRRVLRCVNLAAKADTDEEKSHLLGLAVNWEKLAWEFEGSDLSSPAKALKMSAH